MAYQTQLYLWPSEFWLAATGGGPHPSDHSDTTAVDWIRSSQTAPGPTPSGLLPQPARCPGCLPYASVLHRKCWDWAKWLCGKWDIEKEVPQVAYIVRLIFCRNSFLVINLYMCLRRLYCTDFLQLHFLCVVDVATAPVSLQSLHLPKIPRFQPVILGAPNPSALPPAARIVFSVPVTSFTEKSLEKASLDRPSRFARLWQCFSVMLSFIFMRNAWIVVPPQLRF